MKYFYLLCFLLFLPFVSSTDKFLLSIPFCYNVTVFNVDLLQGNFTDVSFKDCVRSGDVWFCDCHDKGDFNLILQSDGSSLDSQDWRFYRFDFSYSTYALSFFNDSLIVKDYGDAVSVVNHDSVGVGSNLVYVSSPVYIDREVEVNYTKNIVEFIERNVSVEVFVENTSKIDECNLRLNVSSSKVSDFQNANTTYFYSLIVLFLITCILGYYLYRKV